MPDETLAPAPKRSRPLVRVIRFSALGALVLAIGLTGSLMMILNHLGSPAIKGRIIRALKRSSGLSIEYEDASLSFWGVHLTGLRVLAPRGRNDPPVIAVDRMDGDFDLLRAVRSRKLTIRSFKAQGVHVVIDADDDGTTSLTRLVAKLPQSPSVVVPLSRRLSQIAKLPIAIESVQIGDVDARLVRRRAGQAVGETRFTGLRATLVAKNDRLDLSVATPLDGARLDVTGARGERSARADLLIHFSLDDRARPKPRGDLAVEASLRQQNFLALPEAAPAVDHVLSVKAHFDPDVAAGHTDVVVERLSLLAGAGAGSLDATLVDAGAGAKPIIRQASLRLDVARLQGFLPGAFGTLEAPSGRVDVTIAGLDLSEGARLARGGTVEVGLDLPSLDWHRGDDAVSLTHGKLTMHARPGDSGMDLSASLPFESLHAAWGGHTAQVSRGTLTLASNVTPKMRVSGTLALDAGALNVGAAPIAVQAREAELHLKFADAGITTEGPLFMSGGVTLSSGAKEIAVQQERDELHATGVALHGPLHLAANASGSVDVHLSATSLEYRRDGHVFLAPTPVRLAVDVPHFAFDERVPWSRGEAKIDLGLGGLTASATLQKNVSECHFVAKAASSTLALVRPFAGSLKRRYRLPWERMGFSVETHGSVTNIGSAAGLKMAHVTTLELDHAAIRAAHLHLAAQRLTARVSSSGNAIRHKGTLKIGVDGFAVGRRKPGPEALDATFTWDRTHPSLDLTMSSAGGAAPAAKLKLHLQYTWALHRLLYTAAGTLHDLGMVEALLPAKVRAHHHVEWDRLELDFDSSGAVDQAVRAFNGWMPVLARDPLNAIRGTQTFHISVADLHYADAHDDSADVSSIGLRATATEKGTSRHVEVASDVPEVKIVASGIRAELTDLRPAVTADFGEETGQAHLTLALRRLTQTAYPPYPVGDLSMDVVVRGDSQGSLHIDSAQIRNSAGGTTLDLSGGLDALFHPGGGFRLREGHPTDAVPGRRGFTLHGTILQRIEALPRNADFSGSGLLRVPFTVESGDLRFYHVSTAAEFEKANLAFPGRGLSATGVNASIPIKQDFLFDDHGLSRLGGLKPNAYPIERFFDYQPYLNADDFVTIDALRMGGQVVGPVAGYLRVNRNVFSLDQIEMTALAGKVTGQLVVDYAPAHPEATDVLFRGNVTGLEPARAHGAKVGEPLDANAALRFNPRRLSLEGRIDIVRIGRGDLRALLDMWDPYHSDPSANRIRDELSLGYPKQVRLLFENGFASMSVELGGVASLLGIDAIQAVPIGPLLEKYVLPYLGPTEDR